MLYDNDDRSQPMHSKLSIPSTPSHIIGAFIFFILVFLYTWVYKEVFLNFHDEAIRVGRGYLFELVLKGDFRNPLWQTADGYDQPQLPQLVYGAMIYPKYQQYKTSHPQHNYLMYMIDKSLYDTTDMVDEPLFAPYVSYQKNLDSYIDWKEYIHGPNELYSKRHGPTFNQTLDTIYTARRINIIFLALSALIFYALTLRFMPIGASFITTLWFGANSLIVSSGLRAHNEGLFLLFFVSGLYLLVTQLTQTQVPSIRKSIVLGVVAGLCMASKLNGAMLSIYYIFYSLLFAFLSWRQKQMRRLLSWVISPIIVCLVMFGTFVLLNPFTYGNPISNTWRMYTYRQEQVNRSHIYDPTHVLPTIKSRLSSFGDSFFGSQTEYFSLPYGLAWTLPHSLIVIFSISVFLLGIYEFFKYSIATYQSKMIFVGLGILTLGIMTVYMGLYMARYLVPLAVFITWFEGMGIYTIAKNILKLFKPVQR
jgi:hypothetical protein